MDHKEFHKYSTWCWNHGIFIFPECNNSGKNGRHKIIVSRNGKEKVTKKSYVNSTSATVIEESLKTYPSGRSEKVKTEVPSLWRKIEEMYKEIYEKNFRITVAYEAV